MRVRPEYDMRVIGRNLKKLRLANHLTVEEVRAYMQLGTVQSIYKWERGEGLPQADSLIALMQLYGANRIEMITEEGAELSSVSFLVLLNYRLNDILLFWNYNSPRQEQNEERGGLSMKMTSAYANKMLRTLNDEKEYWLNRERESFMYTAAVGEEPVIPEYDYEQVSQEIAKIDEKIIILKHAINESNVTARISVGDQVLSVDTILVKMTLMNRRKDMLDTMRKQLPKARTMTHSYTAKTVAPEYRYINYDLDTIRRDFEQISHEILEMQVALDRYNQTEEFEVAL